MAWTEFETHIIMQNHSGEMHKLQKGMEPYGHNESFGTD